MSEYLKSQEALSEKHKRNSFLVKDIKKLIDEVMPLDDIGFVLETPMSVTIATSTRRSEDFYAVKGHHIELFVEMAKAGVLNKDTLDYRKKSLIGGERFKPIDAYLGSTGKVFIRFVEAPHDGDLRTLGINQLVEFEYTSAMENLTGFDNYLSRFLESEDDRTGESAIAAVLDEERFAANNKYGSW